MDKESTDSTVGSRAKRLSDGSKVRLRSREANASSMPISGLA